MTNFAEILKQADNLLAKLNQMEETATRCGFVDYSNMQVYLLHEPTYGLMAESYAENLVRYADSPLFQAACKAGLDDYYFGISND